MSGLAAGFATGTATAALAELQPCGDRQAAGSNMTGLGLGPLIAGLFAEYVALPTRSVFWAYLGLCALALAGLLATPETVHNPDKAVSLRPRLGVPPAMRVVVLGACLGVFAAFSLLGLFSSLVPTFLHGILGVRNLALVGAAASLIFFIAAISQAASARLPARRSMSTGLPLLLLSLAAVESALFARALWLFLAGTVVGGAAVGLIFRGGLAEIYRLAEPAHRAAVVSTFFAAAYAGLGLPPVLTGLISQLAGAVNASAYTSGIVGTHRDSGHRHCPAHLRHPAARPAARPGQRQLVLPSRTSRPAQSRVTDSATRAVCPDSCGGLRLGPENGVAPAARGLVAVAATRAWA